MISIAVAAVVKPSRLLRASLAGYALACTAAAMALAARGDGHFHFPLILAAACLLSSLAAWRAAAQAGNPREIDISGPGEIRLTVQHCMGTADTGKALVELLPGSTVWPGFMLLLLRDLEQGAVTVLTILPDSMAPDQFRRIAIAIRAIAGRDNKFFRKHKIL